MQFVQIKCHSSTQQVSYVTSQPPDPLMERELINAPQLMTWAPNKCESPGHLMSDIWAHHLYMALRGSEWAEVMKMTDIKHIDKDDL